jgi:hypothetical protein
MSTPRRNVTRSEGYLSSNQRRTRREYLRLRNRNNLIINGIHHPDPPLNQEPIEIEDVPENPQIVNDETLGEHRQNSHLKFLKRLKFEAKETETWRALFSHGVTSINIYNFVESYGYFLPPFNSKPISINYCMGVYEKQYFCLIHVDEHPNYYKKVNKYIYYYEILRYVAAPLGYNSLNLPPKKYLASVLFNLDNDHFFFTPNKKINLQVNEETGLFIVPDSCQGLIKIDRARAVLMTDIVKNDAPVLINLLAKIANVIRHIEHIREKVHKLQKTLAETAFIEDNYYKHIYNHFQYI